MSLQHLCLLPLCFSSLWTLSKTNFLHPCNGQSFKMNENESLTIVSPFKPHKARILTPWVNAFQTKHWGHCWKCMKCFHFKSFSKFNLIQRTHWMIPCSRNMIRAVLYCCQHWAVTSTEHQKGREQADLNTVRETELQATPSSFKSKHIRTGGSASKQCAFALWQ